MGRRGPPPKPTALKDLHGTRRADREPKNEPVPPPGRPACPRHLGPLARAAWRHWEGILVDMGVLTVADRTILELTCSAYAEYRHAAAVLAKRGPVVSITTGKGRKVQVNPAAGAAADAWRRTVVGLRELGLTPAARARVEADPFIPPGTPPPPAVAAPTPRPRDPNDPLDEFAAPG